MNRNAISRSRSSLIAPAMGVLAAALLFGAPSAAQPPPPPPPPQNYAPPPPPPPQQYDGPSPEFIASTEPVYYEGHAAYWYNNHWYWRDEHGRWNHYDQEPPFLADHRAHFPQNRRSWEGHR
jgi:hypothetical protein